ncbi:hypothetical protein [Candidatus Laterigemmans baculatus]|uniref:hypothetical protein n=1 Tax=Candidatus Laterigemmans baculatus TaxID=2770505 RepID=UPI0013D9AFE8|nr:hypothetical protein [Candidatus Laterigemmans baculatus]
MSNDPGQVSPVFRIDVSADSATSDSAAASNATVIALLRELVAGQERQNQLLESLAESTAALQKQRMSELQQWKDANPRLARSCRRAAETLSRVQTQFLETMTDEITDNEECLLDGEFMLNEFVDRFGPRMAHLNGVLQVLAQLGSGVPANH